MAPIHFYLPSAELVAHVPSTMEGYWPWFVEAIRTMPARLPSGEPCALGGPHNWTIQTVIQLRSRGFECSLSDKWPDAGIIVVHSSLVPAAIRPTRSQFIVEVKPDKFLQSSFAHFAIVQNPRDSLRRGCGRFLIDSAVVSYWPQPGLVPRSAAREARFENVYFMGNAREFLSNIDELAAGVERLGLRFVMAARDRWHDYRDADAVVGVRRPDHEIVDRKPPSKLVNAWMARTPAILSPDSAFEDLRRSELDYLRATNVQELVAQVRTLKNAPDLRLAMALNGARRAVDFSAEAVANRWMDILTHEVAPAYEHWRQSPVRRFLFMAGRGLISRTIGVDPDTRRYLDTV